MIQAQYKVNSNELARANVLFIEKKTFLSFVIKLVNFFTLFLLSLAFLKLVYTESVLDFFMTEHMEILTVGFCVFWLTCRRIVNQWSIKRNLEDIDNEDVLIKLTENGIKHRIMQRNISANWSDIKNIYQTGNGFIFSYTKESFLWLPYSALESDSKIDEIKSIFHQHKVHVEKCTEWVC